MNKSNSFPQIQPWLVRLLLAVGALFSLGFVIYASLVPLNYTPKPFAETLAIFQSTPWFQLGIERRADWVANGLIMLPPGFLAAGAIDWRRTRRWLLLFASPLIIALLIATVVGIEFVQIWFPPRVVSQNDILAGVIGSFCGVQLWWLCGRHFLGQIEQFVLLPPGITKWNLLMNFAAVGLLVYNLMPLDILVTFSELNAKWNSGNIRVVPFQDFRVSKETLISACFAFARLLPFAYFRTLQSGGREALTQGVSLAILLEIVKLPIHSRVPSATGIVLSCIGVLGMVFMAPRLAKVVLVLDRAAVWFIAALSWAGVMIIGFLGRFEKLELDSAIVLQRLEGILIAPFARAHASSEFEAGENIVLKLFAFAVLVAVLTGWCSRIQTRFCRQIAVIVSTLGFLIMALGVEVGQAFLPPLVPDATDFILYAVGGLLGFAGFNALIPRNSCCGVVV